MPVEAYALVAFTKPLTKEEKEFNTGLIRHHRNGRSTAVSLVANESIYKLCHICLVQPSGKKGSVPLPKWDVVEEIQINVDYDIEGEKVVNPDWHKHIINAHYLHTNVDMWEYRTIMLNKTIPILFGLFNVRHQCERILQIDDRRIQLKQIRQLFPECANMPLPVALDYVRDRL